MSEMQFETEQQNEFGRPPQESAGMDWTGKMVAWGFASNRQQAEYVMLALGILILVVAYFLYRGIGGGSDIPPLLPPTN